MKHIVFHSYCAYDWHDWSERSEMLKTAENGIDFSSDDIDLAVIKDATQGFKLSEDKLQKCLDIFKEKGFFYIVLSPEYEFVSIEDDAPKESFFFQLFKKEDGSYVGGYESQITLCMDYKVYDTEKEKIKYLPIREYISFPKIAPLVERCFCEAFDTYEEAENFKMPDNCHYFSEEERTEHEVDMILPITEEELNGKWYKEQLEVLSMCDKDWFVLNFTPFTDIHKIALAIRTEDIKYLSQKENGKQIYSVTYGDKAYIINVSGGRTLELELAYGIDAQMRQEQLKDVDVFEKIDTDTPKTEKEDIER